MNTVRLFPPRREGQTIHFGWEVTPATALYRRPEFYLRFPDAVALDAIPEALWWRVLLICLHSHWTLLRPCRVELPVRLPPEEIEFWLRLIDIETATLESYRGTKNFERSIELVATGEPLASTAPIPDTGRCSTAFSGGKDSLLQVGLLGELSKNPLLVTTTSPLPGMHDQLTERRRHVLREITRRKAVTLVEVESDYRSCWENLFSRDLGYPVSVNEISDTFLYFASLLVVSVAEGAPHLFLASEAEVQENAEIEGHLVMHPHYMYAAVVQRALARLLAPLGISYSSLTWPLQSEHVQETLWGRYEEISDLQYSCWQVGLDDAACSQCSQCLRLAVGVLALEKNPERMGIDLRKLFPAMRDWSPNSASTAAETLAPRRVTATTLNQQVVRNLQRTSLRQVERVLIGGRPWRWFDPKTRRALDAFQHLKSRLAETAAPPGAGYRPGFVDLVDPIVREPLRAIFASSIPAEPASSYQGVLERSCRATAWIVESLDKP